VFLFWRFSLVNLLVAASIGVLLRLIYIVELPITFRGWMHGHSHGAMLGWLFPAFLLLAFRSLNLSVRRRRSLLWLFALNQLAVGGMFVAFPYQSYGPVSSGFSTLQLAVSYAFIWAGWPVLSRQTGAAGPWWQTALVFLAFSTLGLWGVASTVLIGGRSSEVFVLAVQFFLHFQFNGWFLFAVFALMVHWLHQNGLALPNAKQLRWLWTASALSTFSLAIVWSERVNWVFAVNAASVFLQLYTGVKTWHAIRPMVPTIKARVSVWSYRLLVVAACALLIKVLIQAAVALPAVAVISFTIRNYVVGFIHLMMLGIFTAVCWAFALAHGWLNPTNRRIRLGFYTFGAGVFTTELLLFGQGSLFWAGLGKLPGYYTMLVVCTVLLWLGALLVLVGGWRNPKQHVTASLTTQKAA